MKKFITLFTILFSMAFAGSAMAQDPVAAPAGGGLDLKAGTMFGGGTIGFSKTTTSFDFAGAEDIKLTTIEFAPSFGYFVTPEIAAIGTLIYRILDNGGPDDQTTTGLYAGARYHMPMGKLYLFGQGELGLEMVSEGDTDATAYGLRLGVGILYPFNPHVAVEAGLKFTYMMGSMDNGADSVDLSMTSFGLGYFGFVGYFNL